MNTLLQKLLIREDLTIQEAQRAAESLLNGTLTPIQTAALLSLLAAKGESVDELIGFANGIKKHMITIRSHDAIDACGTGGDGKNTFNISTAVALIVASGGVRVAKHGNSAVSSKCGSADVLRELGVFIELKPDQAEEVLKKTGIVFLFAPLFHPTFKNVSSVRHELGIPTIFNYLGPLVNPAGVKKQMIGVPNREIAEKLIQVGRNLGYEHLLVVTGDDGLDEVSISGKTQIYELKQGRVTRTVVDPLQYGFKRVPLKEIKGGTQQDNAKIILDILNDSKGSRRDIVVLNSAFAFYVAGRVANIRQGIKLAEILISSRKAKKTLEDLVKETQKYA